jgi:hypothetical protein
MKTFALLIVALGVWLVIAGCTASAVPPPGRSLPPPEPRNLPGQVKGRVKTRWLAPFVNVTTRSIGQSSTTTVQWFIPDGKMVRDLTGPNVDAHPGYVYEIGKGQGTIHAVNGDWKIALPQKPGPAGYVTATEDSRTFVHEFHPQEGEIAADVYVDGKLAGTLGPFLQYQGQDVQLGCDGSVAFLVWKDEKKNVVQVVVAGPSAKVRFRVNCEGPVMSPIPAPDGAGVLVQINAGGQAHNTFTFYTKAGKVSSVNVGPNAGFLAWLPGTTTAVMHTSVGHDYRFHLIDWKTGKRVWDIPDPNPARVPGALPPVTVVRDTLLLGGLELIKGKEHQESIRSIYALDPKTGKILAHWLPEPLNQPSADGGRFLQLGGKLFLVTDEEFGEIKVDDITAKIGGWK